jgi:hypothetical protein
MAANRLLETVECPGVSIIVRSRFTLALPTRFTSTLVKLTF